MAPEQQERALPSANRCRQLGTRRGLHLTIGPVPSREVATVTQPEQHAQRIRVESEHCVRATEQQNAFRTSLPDGRIPRKLSSRLGERTLEDGPQISLPHTVYAIRDHPQTLGTRRNRNRTAVPRHSAEGRGACTENVIDVESNALREQAERRETRGVVSEIRHLLQEEQVVRIA